MTFFVLDHNNATIFFLNIKWKRKGKTFIYNSAEISE